MNNKVQIFIFGKNDQLVKDIKKSLKLRLGEFVIYTNNSIKYVATKKIEEIITILHNIGMPTHLKGYQYILEILKCNLLKNNDYKIGDIYRMIGKKFNTESNNVERSIRNAIEICWQRGDYYFIEKIFGHSINFEKNKPSNTELIYTIYEYISNRLMLFVAFILAENMIN